MGSYGKQKSLFNDDTERVLDHNSKSELALKKGAHGIKYEENKYKRYFNNAADLIAIIDDRGTFLEINNRFEKETGHTYKSIIGKNLYTAGVLSKESAKKANAYLKDLLAGERMPMFEVDGINKDETITRYEVRAVPIKDGNNIVAIQANLRNIQDRLSVENALTEREERYHTLFQLSPSGIILEDSNGVILDVNPAFCNSLGYDREELIGKNVEIIVHPDNKNNVKTNISRLMSGETLKHVEKSIRKNGTSCYMELNEKKITLPDGQGGILCISEDISDRQHAQEELLKKAQLQKNLLNTARHLTRSLDIKEVLNEVGKGVMEILNTQSCAIYLLEPDLKTLRPVVAIDPNYKQEVLKTPLEIGSSFTGQAVVSKQALIFNETGPESIGQQIPGTPEELEERIIVAPFIVEGKVIGAICLSRMEKDFGDDELALVETYATYASAALKNAQLFNNLQKEVEERNQVQQKINELNLQYESFIHNSLVGIWKIEFSQPISTDLSSNQIAKLICDTAVFADCNDALARMYKFNFKDQILGKYAKEFSTDMNSSVNRLEQFVKNGYKTEMLETEEKDIKGNLHSFRNSYVGMVEDKKLLAIWGVQMDITDQRRLEEQLRQSQKLEAVGTLAGGIAHDFNNLLTVIIGHAEMSMMILDADNRAHKDIISILSAGKKAKTLTSQLLAFSRKQIYSPKIIEINRVISSLDKMLRRLIGEDIDIETNLREGLPLIKADPSQIEQILMNLIVNARDAINEKNASAAEKKILVETNTTILDESFISKHTGSSVGPHIVLTVSDTGIGMDERTVEKVFEPFFTTKGKGAGTGLGMSTVYGIVKQNNGSIYAFSEPGLGTTVKIYWPASEEKKITDETQVLTKAALLGNESILVVEDDEGVRNLLSTALKDLGYTVNEAVNGKKALDFLNQKNVKVDLLITDLIMPEMNGKELASKIEKVFPEIKVLFTSGYTEDQIVNSGSLIRGVNFLQKPYSLQALAKKVREVLEAK